MLHGKVRKKRLSAGSRPAQTSPDKSASTTACRPCSAAKGRPGKCKPHTFPYTARIHGARAPRAQERATEAVGNAGRGLVDGAYQAAVGVQPAPELPRALPPLADVLAPVLHLRVCQVLQHERAARVEQAAARQERRRRRRRGAPAVLHGARAGALRACAALLLAVGGRRGRRGRGAAPARRLDAPSRGSALAGAARSSKRSRAGPSAPGGLCPGRAAVTRHVRTARSSAHAAQARSARPERALRTAAAAATHYCTFEESLAESTRLACTALFERGDGLQLVSLGGALGWQCSMFLPTGGRS